MRHTEYKDKCAFLIAHRSTVGTLVLKSFQREHGRRIKYKQRSETKSITVVYVDMKGQPFNIVYRNSLRKGEFDTGYHFYIDAEGTLSAEIGRASCRERV